MTDKHMAKEITIKNYQLSNVDGMTKMANVLKTHIVSHKLFTTIAGKNYVHVEGWQFAGGMLGLFPRIISVENLSSGNEIKWRAEVEIVNIETDKVISRGFAVCSNKEAKKKSFDEYAVLSMAQTRAIGKTYRNIIGWVMKLAGYEGTPSEEMKNIAGEAMPIVEQKTEQKKKEEKLVNPHLQAAKDRLEAAKK
jgi:hypothetical protein